MNRIITTSTLALLFILAQPNSTRAAEIKVWTSRAIATVRLGIAGAIKSKVTRPETDVVSELVAKGEVELGLVVSTQILTTAGVDFVGPLPREIQSYVMFTAGVSANAKAPEAGRQLIQFLTTPRAIRVIKTQGMEPAQ